MKRKDEKAYFNNLWESMTTHFKAFTKDGDQEELHQFRVHVKKIRALLSLLDACSLVYPLTKDFKAVKKIFKHCGEIRNAYINLQLSVRYQFKNEEFLLGQLYHIENGTNAVKEQRKVYLEKMKVAHRKIEDHITAIDDEAIVHFYHTNLDHLANALEHVEFNEKLHDARKQVKILLYNLKLADKALEGKLKIHKSYMDKLQALLGTWHDNVLALELFSGPELNYEPIVQKIKKQDARLKRSIAVLIQEFRKKAVITQLHL